MKLSKEQVTVAKGMKERGTSVRQLAKQLGVTEGALRYRIGKVGEEAPDGRANQPTALEGYEGAVLAIQERLGDGRLTGEGRPCQVREIYDVLVRDHGYRGCLFRPIRPPSPEESGPLIRSMPATPIGAERRWRDQTSAF